MDDCQIAKLAIHKIGKKNKKQKTALNVNIGIN
jgi:hypothetical protein